MWIKTGTLTFPSDKQTPVVMVGPGTGIAPFHAYVSKEILHDLNSQRRIVVYFGCRHKLKDYYFENDWGTMEDFENFSHFVAFSRDGSENENKTYVQHLIEQHSTMLYELILEQKGYFYIAGNSKLMPDAVTDALKMILMKHGSFTNMDEAQNYVNKMELENRFQTETWS